MQLTGKGHGRQKRGRTKKMGTRYLRRTVHGCLQMLGISHRTEILSGEQAR